MNKLIDKFDLPNIQNDDFLFFSLLTNNKIVCYITNDISNETDYIYIKKVKLSNDEYNGFIIQLKLLDINFNHKHDFYVVYTREHKKNYLNYNETYLLSSIILFKTSLNYCKILHEKYHSLDKDKLNILINLSKYILKYIEHIDIANINVLSSCVLFLYGIRNFNDIDLNIKYENSKNFKTIHFKKIMSNIGNIFKKKYNTDIDTSYSFEHKNLTKVFPDYNQFLKWYKNEKLAKILYNLRYNNNTLKHFNVKSESKILYNPSNYFYFLGVKFVSIEYEMYRRYESLTTKNSWNTCHSKRFSELIYLVKHKLVSNVTIPFYEKEYTAECYLNTQKLYKEQFNEDISIKTIEYMYDKLKNNKYNINSLYFI